MAVIHIQDDSSWVAARWIFGYVVRKLKIPDTHPELARRVADSLEHELYYLFLDDLPEKDRDLVRHQVAQIARKLVAAGPSALASPEYYDGLVAKVAELARVTQEGPVIHSPGPRTD